jgi:hypothetical protein
MAHSERDETVRAELGDSLYVHQLAEVLSDLAWAYNALYYFFDLSEDLISLGRSWRAYGPPGPLFVPLPFAFSTPSKRRLPASGVISIPEQEALTRYVDRRDWLQVQGCQIASPGWIDLLGKLNPLEVLRQWAQDQHERRKDRSYRQAEEKRRLQLENDIRETELFQKQIELLREAGVPKTAIKRLVSEFVPPFRRLHSHMSNGTLLDIKPPPIEDKTEEPRQ